MLNATDSFVQYLKRELDGTITVKWRRQTPLDEYADVLEQDALNVKYLGFYEDGSVEYCLASLDILGSDERTVMTKVKAVRDVLMQTQFTAEMDWSIPTSPVLTGRTISWPANKIRFINVRVPQGARFVHYNCSFPLIYTRE